MLIAVVCVGPGGGALAGRRRASRCRWRSCSAAPLGNLIDRLRFGYVLDYVGVGPWPTFNVGDVAIAVGAVLIAVAVLRPAREGRSGDGA